MSGRLHHRAVPGMEAGKRGESLEGRAALGRTVRMKYTRVFFLTRLSGL